MAADAHFSHIEKRIRDKDFIFTPDGHIKIIRETHNSTSLCKGKPHIVHKMKQEDFLDISALRTLVTPHKAPDTRFIDACYFKISDKYRIGYELDDKYASLFDPQMPKTKIRLNKGKDDPINNALFTLQRDIPQKYNSMIPLTKEKIKDITELVKQLVPEYFKLRYWNQILTASTAANNGIVDEPSASATEVQHDDLLGDYDEYEYE